MIIVLPLDVMCIIIHCVCAAPDCDKMLMPGPGGMEGGSGSGYSDLLNPIECKSKHISLSII